MRAKSQKPRPTHTAAANRDRSGPSSSATSTLQSKSHKVEAISNSRSPADNPATVQQLKEREQGSTLQAMMQKSAAAPGQQSGGVVQRALIPLDGFKAQFKDDKERKSDVYEYHAQICSDLKDYHKYEYDPAKNVADEISVKYDVRKSLLEKIILGCQLWTHDRKQRPANEPEVPWNAVQNLKADATLELNTYYSNDEGRSALFTYLSAKKQQKQTEVYSADEFKGDANLGMVTGNVGDMSVVVGKLKAFHAIKENPDDDSTRVEKLTTLDSLLEIAKTTYDSTRKQLDSKGNPGFWKDQKSHLNALDNLIAMLKGNRYRYADADSWRSNLEGAHGRNKEAAEGKGVKTEVVDADWVDVTDEYEPPKEFSDETLEILKRLGPGGNG